MTKTITWNRPHKYERINFVRGSFYVSCTLDTRFDVIGQRLVYTFSKKEAGLSALRNGLQSTTLPLLVCAQTLSPSLREDATKWAYSMFLPQKELFSCFYHSTDFSIVRLNFLLCNKIFCCTVKLSAVQ